MLKILSPWGITITIQSLDDGRSDIYDVPIAPDASRRIIVASYPDAAQQTRWLFFIGRTVVSDFDSACEALTDAVLWLEEAEHLPMQTYHVVQD